MLQLGQHDARGTDVLYTIIVQTILLWLLKCCWWIHLVSTSLSSRLTLFVSLSLFILSFFSLSLSLYCITIWPSCSRRSSSRGLLTFSLFLTLSLSLTSTLTTVFLLSIALALVVHSRSRSLTAVLLLSIDSLALVSRSLSLSLSLSQFRFHYFIIDWLAERDTDM